MSKPNTINPPPPSNNAFFAFSLGSLIRNKLPPNRKAQKSAFRHPPTLVRRMYLTAIPVSKFFPNVFYILDKNEPIIC